MEQIKIYGASDDLVEVECVVGEVKGCDEYSGGNDQTRRVILHPTGDVFTVKYGRGEDGVWVVEHEVNSGKLDVRIERAPEGGEPDPYTDTFHVSGEIARVESWFSWPPSADELRAEVETMLDNGAVDDLNDWETKRLYRLLNNEMPSPSDMGRVTFNAYRAQRGGKNHDGSPTPTWEQLTEGVRDGWTAAAAAALGD